ncbi:MAG TPA: DNA polymerase Y family protein, partial [Stellaceae bacterium]|nr:DNA polymerase Y family protein [Stellaceae bacterium]
MNRVLYVFLPNWAIDRLRRAGLLPHGKLDAQPGSEAAAPTTVPPRRKPEPISAMDPGFRRDDAEPSELPFATVVSLAGRQLLAAVNPAAAAKGLAPSLPLADALSFLPGLVARPAEPAEDAAAMRRLAEWCGRYSPWTAPDDSDGIKIEIAGSAHLWGGEAELAADLSRRLARQNIGHRLAIADTLGAAWAAAHYASDAPTSGPTGCKSAVLTASIIIPPERTREAITPLPVAALRLDPMIVQGLHRVGLRRVGNVMAMPRDALARRFGEAVTRRLDQALGDLPEPLSPMGEVPSRRVRLSFAEPITEPADLARTAERLTQDLVTRLAREGMGARRLDLGFYRVDGRVEHIRIGTARPSRDPVHLTKLMIGKLDTVDPGLGIEDAILAAFAVESLAPEQLASPALLKASSAPTPPPQAGKGNREAVGGSLVTNASLAPFFDRIGARLGLDALSYLDPRESHIPERASVAMPVMEGDAPKTPPRPPL